MRAVAVLLVIVAHASRGGPPVLIAIGDHGVDLFFVISGLCLSLALARDARPRVLPFLVTRFVRIAPPYYVALALFAALALTPFGYPAALPGSDLSSAASAHELVMDALFSGDAVPIHDTSFWTLFIEMRWYVYCVPLVLLWRRSRAFFVAVGAAAYGLYALTPFGIVDEGTLPAFMLGIVASTIGELSPRARAALSLATLTSLAIEIVISGTARSVDHVSPLWHLALFGLVVCGRTEPFARLFAWRPLATIGTASYSIYLVHQPVIDALEDLKAPPLLAALAGLACGFAFWVIVERPLARPDRRRELVNRILRALRWPVPSETARTGGEAPAVV